MALVLVASGIKQSSDHLSVTADAANTSGANLLVAVGWWYNPSNTFAGFASDSKSNSWTGLTKVDDGEPTSSCRIFYSVPTSVGSGHTIKFSGTSNDTGACYPGMAWWAFSGADVTPFDGESAGGALSAAQGVSLSTLQPGALLPSVDGCVLISVLDGYNTAASGSINLSFTAVWADNASEALAGGGAYLIETTAASKNPAWSWTGATRAAAAMAAFRPAAPTAPTMSGEHVNGFSFSATLSQSCIPSSGTGKFTLSGTSAVLSSWAISVTSFTATLAPAVRPGETVTLAYTRAMTSGDISDVTVTNFLADFSGHSVTNDTPQPQVFTIDGGLTPPFRGPRDVIAY